MLTAGKRMRIVVRAILFCAHVAERAGIKGKHGGDQLYSDKTWAGEGRTLEMSGIKKVSQDYK